MQDPDEHGTIILTFFSGFEFFARVLPQLLIKIRCPRASHRLPLRVRLPPSWKRFLFPLLKDLLWDWFLGN